MPSSTQCFLFDFVCAVYHFPFTISSTEMALNAMS